jgi:hypothetical protein
MECTIAATLATQHHSQERYFFLCLRLEGLKLDLGGVLWDYFMAWYGVRGGMEGTGAPLPISFERNHHNNFVCLYNFTIPPCKRKERYIRRLRINVWETSW